MGVIMATVYNIIVGGDNNFTAVYADLNSAIGVGKLYIASLSAFSIIDLKNKKLIDYYTIKEIINKMRDYFEDALGKEIFVTEKA